MENREPISRSCHTPSAIRHTPTLRALLLWAFLIVLVAGPSGAWGEEPEIVARVNGEPVTRAELQRMLADSRMRRLSQRELGTQIPDSKELQRLALQKLIHRRLILQEAHRRNITVTEEEIDKGVAALRSRFKGAKKYQGWLRSMGLDEKSLRESLRRDLLATRVSVEVVKEARVTEEQVQEYYEAHKAELQFPDEVRLRIIAVKDRPAADEVLAALKKGEDFDRLARERSMEARAAQVGDNRWAPLESLSPSLREAVRPLKPGEISGPLQGNTEFIVVRLEERRPPHTKTLAEARPEIEKRLLSVKQQEVLQAWLVEQEKNAKIEVFL